MLGTLYSPRGLQEKIASQSIPWEEDATPLPHLLFPTGQVSLHGKLTHSHCWVASSSPSVATQEARFHLA